MRASRRRDDGPEEGPQRCEKGEADQKIVLSCDAPVYGMMTTCNRLEMSTMMWMMLFAVADVVLSMVRN